MTFSALIATLVLALTLTPTPTPTPTAGPAGPAGPWISPGERFTVAGQPHTVVRLTDRVLVVRLDGDARRGRLPEGRAPELAAREIGLGQAGGGYLVRQEEGDSTDWTLFVVGEDRLVRAAEPAWPPFDGGFRADGSHTRTWLTRYDQIRSELTTPDGTRKVWRWEVAGPGEGGGPDTGPDELGDLRAFRLR